MNDAKFSPFKLSNPELVKLLRKAGSTAMTDAVLQKHLQAGAPTNADGTINIFHYVAWLIRENKK